MSGLSELSSDSAHPAHSPGFKVTPSSDGRILGIRADLVQRGVIIPHKLPLGARGRGCI